MVLRGTLAAHHREVVQAHVPERVLAAGFVSTPPATARAWWAPKRGRVGSTGSDPTAPMSGDRSGDLSWPPELVLGVTANRIYAFAARGSQVGALVGVWDRRAIAVRKARRLASIRLALSFGGSGPPALVSARRFGAGTRPLVTLLVDPNRAG